MVKCDKCVADKKLKVETMQRKVGRQVGKAGKGDKRGKKENRKEGEKAKEDGKGKRGEEST